MSSRTAGVDAGLAFAVVERVAMQFRVHIHLLMVVLAGGLPPTLEASPPSPAVGILQAGADAATPFSHPSPRSGKTGPAEKKIKAGVVSVNSIGLCLVMIPAGTFVMGSPESEQDGYDFERPQHAVKITRPFRMGATEVTQAQYLRIMEVNPAEVKDLSRPVAVVSWMDAVEFCRRLSALPEEKSAGNVYRLPTEAEWEYACRAGTASAYSFGEDRSRLTEYAWFNQQDGPSGKKKPNPWGLYDMHGNQTEWCQDWYGEYPGTAVTDPTGPASGTHRVVRGGSWVCDASGCRSAARYINCAQPGAGFRVVCTPPGPLVPDVAAIRNQLTDAQREVGDPIINSAGMVLLPIPSGEFMMGSPDSDMEAMDREKPRHPVKITRPFHLGMLEVTQSQYQAVMGRNPRFFQGPNRPVEQVSWLDAVEFCRRLSDLPEEKRAGNVYRLPTEAEWEYACRAGTNTVYSFGDDSSRLAEYAWFDFNAQGTTHPAGQKKPNPWGLYDMHGNVWEWCQDWYGEFPHERVTDPAGPFSGSHRVIRGGSWFNAQRCGSAFRFRREMSVRLGRLGFRVVRTCIQ